MIKIFEKRNKLVFDDYKENEIVKLFSIYEIGAIRYAYYDDGEDSMVISIYTIQFLEDICDDFESCSHDIILDTIMEYDAACNFFVDDSKIEVYETEGNSILDVILFLSSFCNKYHILFFEPEIYFSQFSRFVDYKNQQEAIAWWKDDHVFRCFSKN